MKNQEDIFAAELHRLKQQPLFSLVDFESVLDRIRSTVAEVRSLMIPSYSKCLQGVRKCQLSRKKINSASFRSAFCSRIRGDY